MRPYGGQLRLHHGTDVDNTRGLRIARQPDRRYRPGLEARAQLRGVLKRVTGVGINGGQRRGTDSEMIGMRARDRVPVAVRGMRDDELRLLAAQHLDDLAA